MLFMVAAGVNRRVGVKCEARVPGLYTIGSEGVGEKEEDRFIGVVGNV